MDLFDKAALSGFLVTMLCVFGRIVYMLLAKERGEKDE